MNTTKLLTATITGTVVSFVLGYLIYGMALAGYMEANSSIGGELDYMWLILGHIVFSFFVAYIFLQWAGISTAQGGAKAGALIAFLTTLSINWLYLGGSDVWAGPVPTVVDAVGAAVVWAVAGAAVGWVIGRGGE
jgi:hypothetical protein